MSHVVRRVSNDLMEALRKRKFNPKESYEDIIWNLIEDTMTLSEETKKEIAEGRKEIKEGKFVTLEQVKKKYGLD